MTSYITPNELRIGIDIGSLNHAVAISDDKGNPKFKSEVQFSKRGR